MALHDSKSRLSLNDFIVLKELENSLLEQLKSTYEQEKCISDDLLESLHFLYKDPLLEALNQIDKFEEQLQMESRSSRLLDPRATGTTAPEQQSKSPVAIVQAEKSGRFVYQVKGSKGVYYYLFDRVNFCSCSSFKHNVLNRFDFLYCKHILMVKLLKAMDKVHVRCVKEADLVEIIKQIQ